MGPYAGIDYNLTLRLLQSRFQYMYSHHGPPYAKVDLKPMPESTLSLSRGLRIWPLVSCKIVCTVPTINKVGM